MTDSICSHCAATIQNHPWMKLDIITELGVQTIISSINEQHHTPTQVFYALYFGEYYITVEQLRRIQKECAAVFALGHNDYEFTHVLCSRVADRWNLTPRMGVEGYYFCVPNYHKELPPYEWKPMTIDVDDTLSRLMRVGR